MSKKSHKSKYALLYLIMILSFVFITISGCRKRQLTPEEISSLCFPPELEAEIENAQKATESNAQKSNAQETYSPNSCITLTPEQAKELKNLKRKEFIEDIVDMIDIFDILS